MPTVAAPKNIRLDLADYAPPAVLTAKVADRRAFVARLAELALFLKRREIVRGIGPDGKKFQPRKHPRADGANGAALSPHGMASRTAALLAAHEALDFVTLFWRAQGRKSWRVILAYHAMGLVRGAPVRDEFGLSPKTQRQIKADMDLWWQTRNRGKGKGGTPAKPKPPKPLPPAPAVLPLPAPQPKPVPRPRKIAAPTPPPPTPAVTRRGVVYLKPGEKPNPRSRQIQVFGSGGAKPPKGGGGQPVPKPVPVPPAKPVAPKPKPAIPPIPIPMVTRTQTMKPTPAPKPKPLKPTPPAKPARAKVVAQPTVLVKPRVPQPRTSTLGPGEKIPPPPKQKAAPKPPATFAEQMHARVDAEIKRLTAEYAAAKAARDAAEAHWQAVKGKTVGIVPSEYEAAKQARGESLAALLDVANRGQRFETWQRDVKTNPDLIPPFPIAERLRLYAERTGNAKVKAIAGLRGQSFGLASRSGDLAKTVAEAEALREQYLAMAATDPKRRAVMDRLADLNIRRRNLEGGTEQSRHDRAMKVAELISPPQPLAVSQASPPVAEMQAKPIPEAFQPTIDKGLEWIRKAAADGGLGGLAPPMGRNGRTDIKRSHASVDGVVFENAAGPGVVIHEVGHYLDHHSGTGPAAVEFQAYRCGDEVAVTMNSVANGGYMPDEMGRKDRFDQAFSRTEAYYVGKPYFKQGTSEITSMGLEKLYSDPIGFAERDPEFVTFLLGLLDGSLR